MPRWRELLGIFRRLEARGIVRGGRFVSGFQGEQFALPQAVESLREARKAASHSNTDSLEARKQEFTTVTVTIAASDPANLVGIIVPGDRPAATAGRTVQFRGGHFLSEIASPPAEILPSILQTSFADSPPAQLSLGHD
jgi:ATP-dependent Lhr-like helicase